MTTEELTKKYKEQIAEAIADLKTPGRRYRQIPNMITFCRLLAPLAIIPTALSGNSNNAIKLSAIFGATDLIDGYIARKYNLSSSLGADLDALTDKVFAGTLLLTGAISNPYLFANTALEVGIASINLKEKIAGNKPGSTMMGKVKTGAIFALGGLGVVSSSIQELDKILLPLAGVTAVLQSMTIASYLKKYSQNQTTVEEKSSTQQTSNSELLEKLKEESEFLHQELNNITIKADEYEKEPERIIEPAPQKVKN